MQPDARRFIDLATRPFEGEPELRQAAELELEKAIESSSPQQLAEAADALARADTRPHRRKWRIALYLVTLVVSLLLIYDWPSQVIHKSAILKYISKMHTARSQPPEIPNLTEKQRLLIYGDRNAASDADRWKPLWESEPENPAYLAEYAAAYVREHKKLSPEIRAAAERVDPDNGWFLAQAAAERIEGAVTRVKRTDEEITANMTAVLNIHDEQALNESLALLHQCVGKPRFTSYLTALHRERFPLLPPRRDFASQIPPLAYVASYQSGSISVRRLMDAWAAGAQQCTAKADVAGFKQLVADWHAFVAISSNNSENLVDMLVTKVNMLGPANHFRDTARSLGLEEEARYFERLSDYSREDTKRRKKNNSFDVDSFKRRSSILGGLSSPMVARQVKSPPPFSDADMRPTRYADHALFGRAFSGPAWLLFGLAVVCTTFGHHRRDRLSHRLSLRVLDLLRPLDWILLFTGGLVLPVLWYLFISRMSPLAAREWSLTAVSFMPVCGQFGSLIAAMIILPVIIAGRLLEKRGSVLKFHTRSSWPVLPAAVAALAGIPLFGAIPHDTPFSKWLLVFSLVLAGIAVAWMMCGLITLCRKSPSLRRATLIRMIAPVWVAAMLVMALSIPFHYAEEQRWIQQDRLLEITAESPTIGRYEHLVTQVLRREILETLGSLP